MRFWIISLTSIADEVKINYKKTSSRRERSFTKFTNKTCDGAKYIFFFCCENVTRIITSHHQYYTTTRKNGTVGLYNTYITLLYTYVCTYIHTYKRRTAAYLNKNIINQFLLKTTFTYHISFEHLIYFTIHLSKFKFVSLFENATKKIC